MKITIITATYNCEKTIISTLKSISDQRYKNIEHLVVDGGSEDKTLEMTRGYVNHSIKVISEKDDGIYDALNKGVREASGDVVGFLHADDMFQNENVVSKIASAFEDENVLAVYGDLVYVAKDDVNCIVRTWRSGVFRFANLRYGWMPPHPTLYVRRFIFDQIGGFNLNYRISADYDWMLRLLTRSELTIKYIPEVFVRMRLGGISNRSLFSLIKKSSEDLKIVRQNIDGGFFTLMLKNLSKLHQFWRHS